MLQWPTYSKYKVLALLPATCLAYFPRSNKLMSDANYQSTCSFNFWPSLSTLTAPFGIPKTTKMDLIFPLICQSWAQPLQGSPEPIKISVRKFPRLLHKQYVIKTTVKKLNAQVVPAKPNRGTVRLQADSCIEVLH